MKDSQHENIMPSSWQKVPLNDIADPSDRYSLTGGPFGSDLKMSDYTTEGVRVIQLQNIGDGIFNNDYAIYTSNHKANLLRNCNIYPNEIIIAKMADPLARACIIPDVEDRYVMCSDGIRLKVDSSRFNKDYILSSINHYNFRSEAERLGTGTTRLRIGLNTLKSIQISSPPLPEQKAIAKVLTTIDNVIEKTEQLIEKLKSMKKGLMQDLFTRGVLPDGTLRPPREEAPELYRESELGWIPKEWEVDTVLSFTNNDKFAIVDGPFGSNMKTEHYRTSGIPIIQSGFVTSNIFHAEEYLYVDKDKFIAEIRSKVTGNDIVMAKIGAQCGTCAILPENHPVSILAGNCMKISVSQVNSNKYLLHLLHYYYTIGRIAEIISTTAQPAVSMSSLKTMMVIKPNKDEQERIAERIDCLNINISDNDTQLKKLHTLKKGLMDDLLTGKVRVTELLESPPAPL